MFFNNYFYNFNKTLEEALKHNDVNLKKIINVLRSLKKTNKVIIIGNGGSAAIASHVAIDLNKVAEISSLTFNDLSNITALSNDLNYENVFSENIKFLGRKGDVLISISSSGNSKNMINAIQTAKNLKFSKVITFTGMSSRNKLKKYGDINVWVDSHLYNFVENIHQILLLYCIDTFNNIKF